MSLERIRAAEERIAPYIRRTPLLKAWFPSTALGARPVYLKLENLQVSGTLNVRGVLNLLLSLPPEQLQRGFVSTVTGAHGMALAFGGALLEAPMTLFVPRGPALAEMLDTMRSYGAEIVECDGDWAATNQQAMAAAAERGRTYLHPTSNPVMHEGFATMGLELIENIANLEVLVTATGFGGLASALAIVARQVKPSIRVVGVAAQPGTRLMRPESRKAWHLVAKRFQEQSPTGPGQAVKDSPPLAQWSTPAYLGTHAELLDEVVEVTDEEVSAATHMLWTEVQVSTGWGGALAVAALFSGKLSVLRPDQRVCVPVTSCGYAGMF